MNLFKRNKNKELDSIKDEILHLKIQFEKLNHDMNVRIGNLPTQAAFLIDTRPAVPMKEVVIALIDKMELEIKCTPATSSKVVVESKKKANIDNE